MSKLLTLVHHLPGALGQEGLLRFMVVDAAFLARWRTRAFDWVIRSPRGTPEDYVEVPALDRDVLPYAVGVAAMKAILAGEDVAGAVAAARWPVPRPAGAFQGFRPVLGVMPKKKAAA